MGSGDWNSPARRFWALPDRAEYSTRIGSGCHHAQSWSSFPRMGMVRFHGSAVRRAFGGWAGLARGLVFFVSLAVVLEHKLLSSSMQFSVSTDTILLWCAAIAINWGVIRAPYLVFDEEKKRADSAEPKLNGSLKFV